MEVHKKYGKFDKIEKGIGFRDLDHAYIDLETGNRLTSVTTVIGKFEKPFDDQFMSLQCAKRDLREGIVKGMTVEERQEQLLKEWKDKNIKVSENGTRLHLALEIMLKDKLTVKQTIRRFDIDITTKQGKEDLKYITFVHDLNLWGKGELICEDLLYGKQWGISGQSDVVILNKGRVYIRDWKFNSKFLTWEGYNGQKLEFPLQKYEAGKLRIYQLQGSIYMYLKCLETGMKPGDIIIYHFLDGVITEHKLPYLEEDVHRLLEYWYWENKIPKYGHLDIVEGRMSIDRNGNVVRVESVNKLQNKYYLTIGRVGDWFSLEEANTIMNLPVRKNQRVQLTKGISFLQ